MNTYTYIYIYISAHRAAEGVRNPPAASTLRPPTTIYIYIKNIYIYTIHVYGSLFSQGRRRSANSGSIHVDTANN